MMQIPNQLSEVVKAQPYPLLFVTVSGVPATMLPDRPDYEVANAFLVKARRSMVR